jgi:hypothetical protein
MNDRLNELHLNSYANMSALLKGPCLLAFADQRQIYWLASEAFVFSGTETGSWTLIDSLVHSIRVLVAHELDCPVDEIFLKTYSAPEGPTVARRGRVLLSERFVDLDPVHRHAILECVREFMTLVKYGINSTQNDMFSKQSSLPKKSEENVVQCATKFLQMNGEKKMTHPVSIVGYGLELLCAGQFAQKPDDEVGEVEFQFTGRVDGYRTSQSELFMCDCAGKNRKTIMFDVAFYLTQLSQYSLASQAVVFTYSLQKVANGKREYILKSANPVELDPQSPAADTNIPLL